MQIVYNISCHTDIVEIPYLTKKNLERVDPWLQFLPKFKWKVWKMWINFDGDHEDLYTIMTTTIALHLSMKVIHKIM